MKRPVRTGLTVKNDIFTITVLTHCLQTSPRHVNE